MKTIEERIDLMSSLFKDKKVYLIPYGGCRGLMKEKNRMFDEIMKDQNKHQGMDDSVYAMRGIDYALGHHG